MAYGSLEHVGNTHFILIKWGETVADGIADVIRTRLKKINFQFKVKSTQCENLKIENKKNDIKL